MAEKLLTREKIVSEAFLMIDEKGLDKFSLRQVASKLDVRVSSLYNHISNEHDLLLEVAKRTATMYADYIASVVDGKERDTAAFDAGDAFWMFIKEHPYLYELMIDPKWVGNPEFDKALERFVVPIFAILEQYGVKDKDSIEHMLIAMRVVTHGFSSLEVNGAFDKCSVNMKESYHMMIQCVIDMMKKLGDKN